MLYVLIYMCSYTSKWSVDDIKYIVEFTLMYLPAFNVSVNHRNVLLS